MGRFLEHHKYIVDLAVTSPAPNAAIAFVYLKENPSTIAGVSYDSLAVTVETVSLVAPDTTPDLDISALAIVKGGLDNELSTSWKNIRLVTPGGSASGDSRPLVVPSGSTTPADVTKTFTTNGTNSSGVPLLFGIPLIAIRIAQLGSVSWTSGIVKISLDWSTGG